MPEHDFHSPRQNGRADFPHPAYTQTLAAEQYADRKAAAGADIATHVGAPAGMARRHQGDFVRSLFVWRSERNHTSPFAPASGSPVLFLPCFPSLITRHSALLVHFTCLRNS